MGDRPPVPIRVRVEVLSWVNKLAGGSGTGELTLTEAIPPGTTVRSVLVEVSRRYPQLGAALWDPGRPGELGDAVEVMVDNAVLGVAHHLDSPLVEGDRITLLGQYMGGAPAPRAVWRRVEPSVRHEHGDGHVPEDAPGHAAEHHLA